MRTPFPPGTVPDVVVLDPETGWALNVPAAVQEPYGWWDTWPEQYERVKRLRKEQGIEVDDFPEWAMAKDEGFKRSGRLITARESYEGSGS